MSENSLTPNSPPHFLDLDGRKWTIKLTFGLIDRIAEETGIDLVGDGTDTTAVVGLLFDRRKLATILWSSIRAAAEPLGVTQDQFRDSLDTDVLTNGWGALADAIAFFSPPQSQNLVREDIERQVTLAEEGLIQLAASMESEETKAVLKGAMAEVAKSEVANVREAFAKSPGSLPEKSAALARAN